MSDYNGQLPVKTVEDNAFKNILVDGGSGTAATKKLTIAQVGDAVTTGVNDFGIPFLVKDSAGNYALISKTASGGIKTSLLDSAGNEVTFVADGQAVASQRGVAILGTDGTNFQILATDVNGLLKTTLPEVTATDGAAALSKAVQVAGKDGSGNAQIITTDTAGNQKVVVVPDAGITTVNDYHTSAAVVAAAVANHDYTLTTGTFTGMQVLVGARGQVKVEVGSYDGTTFVPKYTFFQQPGMNIPHGVPGLTVVGAVGMKVRVAITNLEGNSSDVSSTLDGSVA